eukprot:g2752.t1
MPGKPGKHIFVTYLGPRVYDDERRLATEAFTKAHDRLPRLIGSEDKGREFDPVWRLNVPIFKPGRKKASSYIEAYMVDIQ